MTANDLLERVARAIDPDAWSTDLPIPTRGDIIAFHEGRQRSVRQARAALTVAIEACVEVAEAHASPDGIPKIDYDDACNDIVAEIRTLLPIIKEPEDG